MIPYSSTLQQIVGAHTGFGDREGDEKLWQAEIPGIALEHPLLMRGILAVSKLHLWRTKPQKGLII